MIKRRNLLEAQKGRSDTWLPTTRAEIQNCDRETRNINMKLYHHLFGEQNVHEVDYRVDEEKEDSLVGIEDEVERMEEGSDGGCDVMIRDVGYESDFVEEEKMNYK